MRALPHARGPAPVHTPRYGYTSPHSATATARARAEAPCQRPEKARHPNAARGTNCPNFAGQSLSGLCASLAAPARRHAGSLMLPSRAAPRHSAIAHASGRAPRLAALGGRLLLGCPRKLPWLALCAYLRVNGPSLLGTSKTCASDDPVMRLLISVRVSGPEKELCCTDEPADGSGMPAATLPPECLVAAHDASLGSPPASRSSLLEKQPMGSPVTAPPRPQARAVAARSNSELRHLAVVLRAG